jgi:PAS domain S-box-containing protein
MKKKDLYILMLEDEYLDAELNKAQLHLLDEYNCTVKWVMDRESYIHALESTLPDIILSDYNIPQYSGLEALNDLKAKKLLIPFIFVTGAIDEETAAGTIKAGAWDYVVKDRLFRLPLAIRSAIQLKEERVNTLKAQEQTRKLSMVVEQCPVNILIIGIDGKIEYVNSRFSEVTGYSPEEVIGTDPREYKPGKYCSEYLGLLWENLSKGIDWHGEAQNTKKDGTVYWEYVSISALKNENGEITHLIAVKEDVSLLKKMEQDLIEARDKAERSDKLKDVFLQNLSHEIRTPLNAIVGFSGLLIEPGISQNQICTFANIIAGSSNQLLSILNDVLAVSRIQTKQEILLIKPTLINEIFDNLAAIFAYRAHEKNISLFVHKGIEDAQFKISTDETKLTQILTNLLNNALKFTHEGTIELGYTVNAKNIDFYVKDTGIGIEKDCQEIIFDRFRQANASISSDYGGTGLGLSISKSFVEMLDGTIKVQSNVGVGSTFSLTIPLKTEVVEEVKRIPAREDYWGGGQTILIVEDEELNYKFLEILLSNKNITLLWAKNGIEAIEFCRNNLSIALVLMDIKMPIMDGYESLKEIRKFRDSLPIIAQTAYALENEKQRFLQNGFNDYIVKPINKEELLEKVQMYLLKYQK